MRPTKNSKQGFSIAPLMGWGWWTLAILVCPGQCQADENAELEKWGKSYENKVLPIIREKCLSCHSGESPDGEFDLSKYPDGGSAANAGDAWERVAKRVRLNEMPPQGSPGLSDPEKGAFHRWVDSRPNQDLCHQLASDETQSWYRGYVMSRRFSRMEYAYALRDLTGTRLSEELLPPSDGAGGLGFDTVGDALFTSPIHLEAYLRAADTSVATLLDGDSIEWVQSKLARLGFAHPFPDLSTDAWPRDSERQTTAAKRWLTQFARRAWRRPATDAELLKLMKLFAWAQQHAVVNAGVEPGSYAAFAVALRQPMQAILVSPHFLFIAEPEPSTAGIQPLSPYQFATRMALLLWSSVPDEPLLDVAEQGVLMEPEVIREQMRRMLADPRALAIGENWGLQWLGLRELSQIRPDTSVFPDYAPTLTADALEETVRTVSDVFREGRPLTDLLDSEFVYINKRLANHYGIDWDTENAVEERASGEKESWSRVPVANGQRGGVLTMASVLMRAAYPRRTSPVLRGRWILEDILGAKVPPPPPNVPSLDESASSLTSASLRERLELHRRNPDCASCHQRMDPLGFGLENYDAIGRWRTEDQGLPIDASGTLPSGESFLNASELKQVLLKRQDEFQLHVVRKWVGYALGRDLNKFDQCVIDASMKRLRDEKRADVILEEILLSYPFQHRYYNPAKATP